MVRYRRAERCQHELIADELNYFFVEFVAGTTNRAFKVGVDIIQAPTDRDLTIIESFVQHQLTLEKVTFSSVGSPTFDSTGDNVILGPVMEYLSPIAEPPYYLWTLPNAAGALPHLLRHGHEGDRRRPLVRP